MAVNILPKRFLTFCSLGEKVSYQAIFVGRLSTNYSRALDHHRVVAVSMLGLTLFVNSASIVEGLVQHHVTCNFLETVVTFEKGFEHQMMLQCLPPFFFFSPLISSPRAKHPLHPMLEVYPFLEVVLLLDEVGLAEFSPAP